MEETSLLIENDLNKYIKKKKETQRICKGCNQVYRKETVTCRSKITHFATSLKYESRFQGLTKS